MKKTIRFVTCIAAALILTTVFGCSKKQNTEGQKPLGMLALLNMTPAESAELSKKRGLTTMLFAQDGYGEKETEKADWNYFLAHSKDYEQMVLPVIFFDNLSSMLMALESGKIGEMEVPQVVGEYLCANNSNLMMTMEFDKSATLHSFGQSVLDLTQGTDFAFMLLKKNAALRDTFNTAIKAMKADGTMARLEKEYLSSDMTESAIKPVTIASIPGAATVKVAVTGDIPPLDYVSSDGTPAGFNTAVLAEISKKTGKNIQLVNIDAGARTTSLASGSVDIVFWTRTNLETTRIAHTANGFKENRAGKSLSDDEAYLLSQINEKQNWTSYERIDVPENTITTEPYYHDYTVCVTLKPKLDSK